jgi:hypothetical protein
MISSRTVYAAAHVVVDPLAGDPLIDPRIDWEATLNYRRYLWSLGLGVAEAMDTAQRGMGLPPAAVHELIERSVAEAQRVDGAVVCGIGTERLPAGVSLDEIEGEYLSELAFVEGLGASTIMMASRALCVAARGPQDYLRVYNRVLAAARRPVILHWLGPMFDQQLSGYWGGSTLERAREIVLEIIESNAAHVDGIKISLLDEDFEVAFRRALPANVKCYTGDDFNYPKLIRGDERGYSHALLGIFDPIAPVAAKAFAALDAGDADRYDALLAPTLPLARKLFEAPTHAYKTGVVFLAYLNGHQRHFRMLGGAESARSIMHLSEVFSLAKAAGVLSDPEGAAAKFAHLQALAGITA